MRSERVSVRGLAEFSLLSGDLFAEGDDIDAMRDGMLNHKGIQSLYQDGMEPEVPLEMTVETQSCSLLISGRADGLAVDGDTVRVDEIKTSKGPVRRGGLPVHWGQAELYAYMACVQHAKTRADVQLTYVHSLSDMRVTRYQREYSFDKLQARFDEILRPYAAWLDGMTRYHDMRDASIKALAFPYGEYRGGQRRMAVRAYRTLRDGHKLLVQAPTGTGKTMAALFPAVRALGDGHITKVMYLTARRTTRIAALNATRLMRGQGLAARVCVITAKQQICFISGTRCTPQFCPYCEGYYDRRREALDDAATLSELDADAIREVALRHIVCPFELSLDISELCDVIICDYNYVFDPNVYLRRYFRTKSQFGLLVDEAHNLESRARDMLSSALRFEDYVALFRNVRAQVGESAHEYTALLTLMKAWRAFGEGRLEGASYDSVKPEALIDACAAFVESTSPSLDGEVECAPEWAEKWFALLDFARTGAMYSPDAYATLYQPENGAVNVTQLCVDATDHITRRLKNVKGTVMFSATLSPMSYYFGALGMDEGDGDRMLELPSPFLSENFMIRCVNVSTRYTDRAQSYEAIVDILARLADSHVGNYLACFPSYAYLSATARALKSARPELRQLVQRPGMTDAERDAFLDKLSPEPQKSTIAFITMGGVFSEGIDLPGDRLSGAAIIGVGMPQVGVEREALRAHFDAKTGEGFNYAYVYPGICRVLQAAGRVIRTEDDAGVALLIDDRFFRPPYTELFPSHWHVRPVSRGELSAQLTRFWRGGDY